MLLSQGCQAGENNISVVKMKQFLNEQTRAIERRAGLLSVTRKCTRNDGTKQQTLLPRVGMETKNRTLS